MAHNVAGNLIDRGIGTDHSVAIMVERNALMVAVMLGVLKSGAHYVPIDPDYPLHRIQKMLNHSVVKKLIFIQIHLDSKTRHQKISY